MLLFICHWTDTLIFCFFIFFFFFASLTGQTQKTAVIASVVQLHRPLALHLSSDHYRQVVIQTLLTDQSARAVHTTGQTVLWLGIKIVLFSELFTFMRVHLCICNIQKNSVAANAKTWSKGNGRYSYFRSLWSTIHTKERMQMAPVKLNRWSRTEQQVSVYVCFECHISDGSPLPQWPNA